MFGLFDGAWASEHSPVDLHNLEIVSDFDDHLACTICYCPFIDPVRLPCDHIFCRRCLRSVVLSAAHGSPHNNQYLGLQLQQQQQQLQEQFGQRDLPTFEGPDGGEYVYGVVFGEFPCPKCRMKHSSMADYPSAPRVLANMCDEVLVRCPFSDYGCGEVMERSLATLHAQRYCEYRPVKCPARGCNLPVPKKKLEALKGRELNADDEEASDDDAMCLHRTSRCPACDEDVTELDRLEHETQLCPALITPCEDCDISLPRRELLEHLEVCAHRKVSCAGATFGCPATHLPVYERDEHEAGCALARLAPYLQTQQDNMQKMEKSITALRRRNEVLQDLLCHKADRDERESRRMGERSRPTVSGRARGVLGGSVNDPRLHVPDGPDLTPWSSRGHASGLALAPTVLDDGRQATISMDADALISPVPPLLLPPRTGRTPRAPRIRPWNASHSSSMQDYSTNADTYLLSLHETLRRDMDSMHEQLLDADSRASRENVQLVNDMFMLREEVAHLNMLVNGLRMQLGRLRMPSSPPTSGSTGADGGVQQAGASSTPRGAGRRGQDGSTAEPETMERDNDGSGAGAGAAVAAAANATASLLSTVSGGRQSQGRTRQESNRGGIPMNAHRMSAPPRQHQFQPQNEMDDVIVNLAPPPSVAGPSVGGSGGNRRRSSENGREGTKL